MQIREAGAAESAPATTPVAVDEVLHPTRSADHAGATGTADEQLDHVVYQCRCRGFLSHRVEEMCLRCLDAYAAGIQLLLSPNRLHREMQRIARCLLREVKSGPRITVGAALRAAERPQKA